MSPPLVSVIVPNYRRPDLTLRCLGSLGRAVAAVPRGAEVVVVDDGSGDDSAERIQRAHPGMEVVRLERNQGYPAAVNAGLRRASGEWVFTLNNDATIDEFALVRLLEAVADRPDVGSAAAQQRFADDRSRIYSAGLVLDRLGINADRLMGMPMSASETSVTEVFGASGAAALYRRTMLDELGGFDESFRFGLEDADLAWRARMKGWRCFYVPSSIVYHDLGGTVPHGSSLRYLQAGRNRVRLIAKNADSRLLRRYWVRMLAYDTAYVGYAAVTDRTLAPLRGRLETLWQWREIRRSAEAGRVPVDLAPPQGLRAALRRRSAWNR